MNSSNDKTTIPKCEKCICAAEELVISIWVSELFEISLVFNTQMHSFCSVYLKIGINNL